MGQQTQPNSGLLGPLLWKQVVTRAKFLMSLGTQILFQNLSFGPQILPEGLQSREGHLRSTDLPLSPQLGYPVFKQAQS